MEIRYEIRRIKNQLAFMRDQFDWRMLRTFYRAFRHGKMGDDPMTGVQALYNALYTMCLLPEGRGARWVGRRIGFDL